MKHTFMAAVLTGLISVTAPLTYAAGHVGQCVAPKTKMEKDGRLTLKPGIYLQSSPEATDRTPLTFLSSFTIKAESKGYVQLVTVPDYSQANPNKDVGKVVGWGKLGDFQFQDLRNCN